jgi:hypothetical protein
VREAREFREVREVKEVREVRPWMIRWWMEIASR